MNTQWATKGLTWQNVYTWKIRCNFFYLKKNIDKVFFMNFLIESAKIKKNPFFENIFIKSIIGVISFQLEKTWNSFPPPKKSINCWMWPPAESQWFQTYMKVKYWTGAVVISLHCKHDMFTYIYVSHKNTAMHCIISQFHTNIKATAPY